MRVAFSVSRLHFQLELYDLKSWLHFTADMRGEFVNVVVTFVRLLSLTDWCFAKNF